MLNSIVQDAQTAVTSLAGAVAGVGSDRVGNYLVQLAGLNANAAGLGDVGLRFIVRAATTSVIFGTLVSYMPQTSENIFFSIVFFAGNRALVSDAVLIGQIVTRGIMQPLGAPTKLPYKTPPTDAAASSCSCAH